MAVAATQRSRIVHRVLILNLRWYDVELKHSSIASGQTCSCLRSMRMRTVNSCRTFAFLSWPSTTFTSTPHVKTFSTSTSTPDIAAQSQSISESARDVLKLSHLDLQSKIVFEDDNILALDKPQGLSVHGQGPLENPDEKPLNLMLPTLAQQLDIDELNIGLSLKRYYSGLVLLTKNTPAAERLQKSLLFATSQRKLFLTYLAIVVGKPQCEMQQKQEMYLEKQYLHGRGMAIVADKSVVSARKEGKMIQTAFSLKIISSNDRTFSSLVEIKISKDKMHAIPVLLSHFLSPVLGDDIYSSRTNYLMGVPIPSPPHIASPGRQRLPVDTENALCEHFKVDSKPLPLFLHRHKVTLLNFPHRSSEPYDITAPPTADFATALDCLGLRLDDNN